MELPAVDELAGLLQEHWDIRGELVPVPTPSSRKVFRVQASEHQFYARWSSSRRDFSALQVVAFIDYVSKCGGAVPAIIPTKDDQLALSVGDRCLSVEKALLGRVCDSTCLSLLPEAGKQMARFHDISARFHDRPLEKKPIRDFVEPRLKSVLKSRLPSEAKEAVASLADAFSSDLLDLPVAWILTHCDPRSANAIGDEEYVAYTDIGAVFQPRISDLVMVQDRWLLQEPAGDSRALTLEETAQFWKGYIEVRPLSEEERAVTGIMWTSYSADRLSHWLNAEQKRDALAFREQLAAVPELLRFPEQILF